MLDETVNDTQTDVQSGGSPATDAASDAAASASGLQQDATSLQQGASGDVQTQSLETQQQEVVVDPIEAVLKDLPSVEELRQQAEQGVKYAAALAELRPVADQAKLQSETLKQWQSTVDRFQNPERLNTQLEVAEHLFKDQVIEGGRSVPDTKGVVTWLDQNSPSRADSLMVDLLESKVSYNGVEDSRLNHVSRQVFGKSVPEIRAALQELETRPAQAIDKAELDTIPAEFHGIWKTLSPELRETVLDERTSEAARTQILQTALQLHQKNESDRQNEERDSAKRVENEQKFLNEATAEGEKAVDEGLGTILNSILDSTFKDISNDTVTLTGSKDTDVRVRGLVGAALVSLTDPVKRPYVEQSLGVKFDPEIDQQSAIYEKATIAAKVAAKYGDKASADARQLEADNAAMWLKAKGNELSSQLVDFFSSILGISNENRAAQLAASQSGRPAISGTAFNPTGGGNGNMPQFSTPLGPERSAEIASRFAR